MRVAIFNVKFSPNLGDGAIAECLEATLRRVTPGISVTSIDLAGRAGWDSGMDGGRRAKVLSALRRLPTVARSIVSEALLGLLVRFRLTPHWRRLLKGVDACVIGGGQLIQQTDLNFPLKLAGVARLCARAGLPAAVYAVGVSECPSPRARKLFSRVWRMPRLEALSARDDASRQRLSDMTGRDVSLARDPALLAAKVWPFERTVGGERRRVGVGITHASVLSHHSDEDLGLERAIDDFVALLQAIAARGHEPICFTNGAFEDELMLDAVVSRAAEVGVATPPRRVPRARSPEELARTVATFDVVVAHRLHALILAYAYGVPSVGLKWDEKLSGFLASTGRADFLARLDAKSSEGVAALVDRCLDEGLDGEVRDAAIAETEAAIASLGRTLITAVARSGPRVDEIDAAASLQMRRSTT